MGLAFTMMEFGRTSVVASAQFERLQQCPSLQNYGFIGGMGQGLTPSLYLCMHAKMLSREVIQIAKQ